MKVYLDNAATTKTAPEVAKAMQPYFTKVYGNASSLHKFGRDAKDALEHSREIIAKKINALPEEIIFTSCGTESDNLAIKGIAYSFGKGHIITSKIEHPAILETCKQLEKEGFKVTYLDVDEEGRVNLEQLKKNITKETILVTIMHANNEIGTIEPIEEIGNLCKEKNVIFHTDAVQSFTKVPIDVRKTNIDLISMSSHKIHGPKGVGALFVRNELKNKLKKQNTGGHHEFDLRAGTENIPGIVGFAKAVELTNDGHIEHMKKLRDTLIKGLLEIKETQLNGPIEKRLCNNVSVSFHFIEGESILLRLDAKGIAVSTGSACSSQSLEPSHVLIAIGLKHEIAHGTIRFSLSRFTTEKEIDYTIKNVKKIVENLRKISPLYKGD